MQFSKNVKTRKGGLLNPKNVKVNVKKLCVKPCEANHSLSFPYLKNEIAPMDIMKKKTAASKLGRPCNISGR